MWVCGRGRRHGGGCFVFCFAFFFGVCFLCLCSLFFVLCFFQLGFQFSVFSFFVSISCFQNIKKN